MILNMKTKLILNPSGGTFGTLRFNEKSFFITLLGFKKNRNYKPTNSINVDSPEVYTIDKILNLGTFDKSHLKGVVIDESVENGLRQPILYSFNLDKPPG